MGERIAVMDRGMLQQVGTADDVYARPANLFVAEFIGSPAMSLFRGDVLEKDGVLVVQAPAITFALWDELAELVRKSGTTEVVVGVRPEHIDIAEDFGERRAAATFSVVVDVVESLGNEVHVTLLVDGRGIVARLPADDAPRAGETRQFAIAPEHLLLFDPATGRRLT